MSEKRSRVVVPAALEARGMKVLSRIFELPVEQSTRLAMTMVNQIVSFLADIAALDPKEKNRALAREKLREVVSHLVEIEDDLSKLKRVIEPTIYSRPRFGSPKQSASVKACTFD